MAQWRISSTTMPEDAFNPTRERRHTPFSLPHAIYHQIYRICGNQGYAHDEDDEQYNQEIEPEIKRKIIDVVDYCIAAYTENTPPEEKKDLILDTAEWFLGDNNVNILEMTKIPEQ